ncbi:hypothetical protein PR202_ga22909 [Eleusine coracana subsp. coracana]|uniref:RING-type domain-containing protein n=1 Tax=Eleusine coracana subsp. coracana TaxID=191504 RepID=A0AAV5D4B0_ELECO|nr:hypothetical protein PR202_ga22909 [Eleusine coracana subsp. coracana]
MMGNIINIAMGLGAQEEEELTVVVDEEERGGSEEEQEEGGDSEEGRDTKVKEGVEGEEEVELLLQCSICLDAVVAKSRERSTATLQCGHEFHLDCIGSAFNSTGTMQCPNCRHIENGHWLYARHPIPSQSVNNDDGVFDEDLDHFAHQQGVFVPLRIWSIPISRLSELSSLFSEIEPMQEAYHDVIGQNINAEPTDPQEPGTGHQGAYVSYMQPLSPVSSSSTHIVDRTVDGQPQYRVHPIDILHHLLAAMPISNSPPNNNNGVAEESEIPMGATRIGGVDIFDEPTEETSNDS